MNRDTTTDIKPGFCSWLGQTGAVFKTASVFSGEEVLFYGSFLFSHQLQNPGLNPKADSSKGNPVLPNGFCFWLIFYIFRETKIMDATVNILNWFEISVSNIMRAKKFYEAVFNIEMEVSEMMGMKMASFPYEPMSGKLSGALVQSDMHKPGMDGVKAYFNGNPDLSDALSRVESAGGKITMPKTHINDDIGYMAFFIDTEGNVVALHSQN